MLHTKVHKRRKDFHLDMKFVVLLKRSKSNGASKVDKSRFCHDFFSKFPRKTIWPKAASLLYLTQLHYLALFTLGDLY